MHLEIGLLCRTLSHVEVFRTLNLLGFLAVFTHERQYEEYENGVDYHLYLLRNKFCQIINLLENILECIKGVDIRGLHNLQLDLVTRLLLRVHVSIVPRGDGHIDTEVLAHEGVPRLGSLPIHFIFTRSRNLTSDTETN